MISVLGCTPNRRTGGLRAEIQCGRDFTGSDNDVGLALNTSVLRAKTYPSTPARPTESRYVGPRSADATDRRRRTHAPLTVVGVGQ